MIDQKPQLACGKVICLPSISLVLIWSGVAFADANPGTQRVLDRLTDTSQAIVVEGREGVQAELRAFEKIGSTWTEKFRVPAVIGKKGFAPEDEKTEGDLRTPAGIYTIGTAFGYGPIMKTSVPYRQATAEDKFIDDVASDQYNTWVHGNTNAKSFEEMKRTDGLYEFGLVVNYNMNPIVKGKGSAIFIHVWRSSTNGTAGCVALERTNVVRLLEWLKPQARAVFDPDSLKN
ncbi:L,D-transpeptidase family protein [Bradyrhizobium sp. 6(2017)]|uniref:L,D-transpeptidase family protein n=1 Tax=Bradyrhizobium sp. 6(2017) TaxID=1197460 RepID=UPI0013E1AF5B|nr:L,D-transpeptidase family protein [Bradyrhizobium sp. 6(2017)]QIG97169.1 L,D-transpeptidase family protein [Bradyrhizobium sp. 6(2017)]